MAFAGCHVACLYVNSPGAPGLIGGLQWSETLASAGTTSRAMPSNPSGPYPVGNYFPSFEITVSAESWVAVGPNPDASQASGTGNAARFRIGAGETRNVWCTAGDKVAWAAA
ncbi:hypothetical protein [Methylobacterium oryzisoli]|uniref:hypothetical protein n=1 Tax=Methylobacterium oryzisoli TaxID=3385502 RepID=UPI003891D94B